MSWLLLLLASCLHNFPSISFRLGGASEVKVIKVADVAQTGFETSRVAIRAEIPTFAGRVLKRLGPKFGDAVRGFRSSRNRSEFVHGLETQGWAPAEVDFLRELANDSGLDRYRSDEFGSADARDDGFYMQEAKDYSPDSKVWTLASGVMMAEAAVLVFPADASQGFDKVLDSVLEAERALCRYDEWTGLSNPYKPGALVDGKLYVGPGFQQWDLRYTATGGFLFFQSSESFVVYILQEQPSNDVQFSSRYYSLHERWTAFFGQDLYLPVYSDEGFEALLICTALACDEDPPSRIIRENLGNLKLQSSRYR